MNAERKSFNNNSVVAVNCVAHSATFRRCLIMVHDMIQFVRSDKESTLLTCRSKIYPVLWGSRVARPSKVTH